MNNWSYHDNTHNIVMTTGSDDQQLPVTVTAGEEVVSEASDVDEPANAEGQSHIVFQYIHTAFTCTVCTVPISILYSNIFTLHVRMLPALYHQFVF